MPTVSLNERQLGIIRKAEKAVVGALLMESSSVARVAGILRPEFFYNEDYGLIYKAILEIWQEDGTPDMIRVADKLMQRGEVEKAGGLVGITELATSIASTANLERWAMMVREQYTRRLLRIAAMRAMEFASDDTEDVEDALTRSVALFDDVIKGMTYDAPTRHLSEVVEKARVEYKARERRSRDGSMPGIDLGIKSIQRVLNGLKAGDLVVLGGRPGMGKTAMMLHFAQSAARSGAKTLIFSLEMTDVSLANRLILSSAEIRPAALRGGFMNGEEKLAFMNATGELAGLPLYIDETSDLSVTAMKVRCLEVKRKTGLDLVMLDYLQLMDMRSDNRNYNREQEIGQTTKRLKQLAKELEVPIVLLSQLNRNINTRIGKDGKKTDPPRLSDLRESGSIEQDADTVLFVHRPEYYEDTDAIKGVGLIIVAKQRDGQTGKVLFSYDPSLTKIGDVDRELPF